MLLGRDSELQTVDGLLAGARLGSAGVLLMRGEAGIGKTALLDHVAARSEGARLLWARCSEAERDLPFGGLSQLLRPTPAELERLPAPQRHALAVALALAEGPVVDRLSVGAAVLNLLTGWGEDRPVVVLVDDAHHLDRPSAEALAFVCRRLLADRVLVLAAVRAGAPSPLDVSGLPLLSLGGLDEVATAALARTRAATAAPKSLVRLHELTGGNPLAVLELSDDLEHLTQAPPGLPVPVPATLARRYGRRAQQLGEGARTLLTVCAAGGGARDVLTRAAAALGVDLDDLVEAETAGLVQTTGEAVVFRHPLVRSSVWTAAPPDERRAVHAVLADVLPPGEQDRRAWHRSEAVVGTDAAAADGLAAVGRRASSRGAHAVAATAFERAAHLSPEAADRAAHLVEAGEAAWRGGDGRRAVALVRAAAPLDDRAELRSRVLGVQADVAAHLGRPARAGHLFAEAADCVRATDPSRAVLLLAEAVSAHFFQGDPTAALRVAEVLERLLVPAAGAGAGPLSVDAVAVGTMAAGMARVIAGGSGIEQVREGVRLLQQAPAEPGTVRPAWLMFGPLWLRESGDARQLVRAALDEARSVSVLATLPTLLFTIARDEATTDSWGRAEADYSEAVALARELGYTTELAISLAGLAWLEARQGRYEQCRLHAAESLALSGQERTTARVWAQFALGEAALAAGETADAVNRFSELVELLGSMGLRDADLSPQPELVEALVREGRLDDARRAADRFAVAAAAKQQPWALARAARLRLLLADPADLDVAFAEAAALHARTPDRFEDARTRLVHGQRLRRARRRVDARVPLTQALEAFRKLGADPWARSAAAELEASGETVAAVDDDDRTRLTPRELQIVLLLLEGRTTRETAAALFLSPKTVEYHLRHVYTRLGIGSRQELQERLSHLVR